MEGLPKQIKYNNKIFKDAGFFVKDCKAYRNGYEIILIKPDGTIHFRYLSDDNGTSEK